jgi:predicted HAD superfamily Cof-like phosphohydrolase
MTPLEMVKEFAVAMGQPLGMIHPAYGQHTDVASNTELMRMNLIDEEFVELLTADSAENLLKELADLVYVIYGYAATFDLDLDEAVRRVHESNMSKLGEDGKPIYRDDGKVLKGPNYKPPYMKDLL